MEMKLVHVELRIEFDETTMQRTPANKVFRAFGGGAKAKGAPREAGAKISIDNIKTVIRWNYDSCQIVIEKQQDYSKHQALLMEFLQQIDSAVPIGNIRSRTLRTEWVLPIPDVDYASLNASYQQKLIVPHDFTSNASDSSIVVDIRIGDSVLHHQSGPMQPKQILAEFLEFERNDLPELFVFLDVGVIQTKVVDYSKKEMQEFLKDAFMHCEAHQGQFGRIWEASNVQSISNSHKD
jgi:hypothetical protein